MRTYETIFITLPTLGEDDERATVEALAQIVSEAGGTFTVKERMGRRRLAYPIRKQEDGVYTRFLYDAEPAVPRELDRRLRINDKVIRHMTIHLEPDWAVAAKEQAIRDEKAREEAEAARAAGLLLEETAAAAEPRPTRDGDERDLEDDEAGDEAEY